MVENFKLHDEIVKYLIKNNSQSVLLAKIRREEYFFIASMVDFTIFQVMKKRKKAMGKVDGYNDALSNIGKYIRSTRDSLLLGEFFFEDNYFHVFFDKHMKAIVASYDSTFANMNKIRKLNKEYKKSNLKLIEYEHYYPLSLDFPDV